MAPMQLAVLASGRGSNLEAISEAIDAGKIDAIIKVVISDKKAALALEKASLQGIASHWINPQGYPSKEEFESAILAIIKENNCDCIVLAGFMRVLTPHFVRNAGLPILNIHPSLLPSFPGLHAQRQAVDAGVRYSGCTVHFVDEGVDTGPIISQVVVPVYTSDDEDSLTERILLEEHKLYPRVISLFCQGKIKRTGRKVIIAGEGEKNE